MVSIAVEVCVWFGKVVIGFASVQVLGIGFASSGMKEVEFCEGERYL